MEISCSQYLSQAKLMSCSSSTTPSSVSPSINFYSKASLLVYNSVAFHSSKSIVTQLKGLRIDAKRPRPKNLGAIHASEADQSTTTDVAERWLLEPVGNHFFLLSKFDELNLMKSYVQKTLPKLFFILKILSFLFSSHSIKVCALKSLNNAEFLRV